jgi:Family of unknown function (DUF5343)
MATGERRVGAVYVGWSTFKNAIDTLAEAMPNRIDRTVFPGLAGGVQGQLLTGLKFLGLVAEDGKPTPALLALAVRDQAERKKQIDKILRASYPELFTLDLTKTTPGELREKMGESYGVSGATLDRALRFFITAAENAGIALSAHVSKVKAANGPASQRRRRTAKPRIEIPALAVPPPGAGGTSKSVSLASGGTLTISASLDLFSLTPEDRKFVFTLIDQLEGYEKASKSPLEEL